MTVVLTGDEPVPYQLRCRSAAAVHEFARAVRRALPVRDADEPRLNGAELMTEEPLGRAAHRREGREQCSYAYVDTHGVRRECTSSAGDADRAEITYDPMDPDTASVGHRMTGWLVFGAVLILFMGSLLVVGLACAVVAVAVAV